MQRFALIDCNNFYVSCERVFNPKLNGRPVIVLSNNDGCIIARSQEAKQLGFKMGQPFFECKHKIIQYDVAVYSSNFALYGDISARVMSVIGQLCAHVEIYSIDEAFVQLDTMYIPDFELFARELQKRVARWTGIPISVGIGQTKTLAKIANNRAKKDPRYNGVCVLPENALKRESILKEVSVADVWGIGWRYNKLLTSYRIRTAYDLLRADDYWVRKRMTVSGLRTVWELRGTTCIALEDVQRDKQSITCSRSFGKRITSKVELEHALASFTARVAYKSRKQDTLVAALYVFITTGHAPEAKRYADGVSFELPYATAYTPDLIRYVHRMLAMIYKPGYAYKKAGVIVLECASASEQQTNWTIAAPSSIQHRKLMKTVDSVNNRWGKSTVFFAAQGVRKEPWHMRQTRRSQQFTSCWHELLQVKI